MFNDAKPGTIMAIKALKECLDIALVLAAFEQNPAILFFDDGILQLLPTSQCPATHKHIGKIISVR